MEAKAASPDPEDCEDDVGVVVSEGEHAASASVATDNPEKRIRV